ncbi:YugN family protein [Paenibacillus sp. A14]|uniref:YugN family protein n=1 Tax=Paenibacillus sp. A14 TaxID=3119820 RepID=UPI003FA6ACE9
MQDGRRTGKSPWNEPASTGRGEKQVINRYQTVFPLPLPGNETGRSWQSLSISLFISNREEAKVLIIPSEIEGMRAYYGDVCGDFEKQGFHLCGNWEYYAGFFDSGE